MMLLAVRLYLWVRYRVWIRQSGGGFINPTVTWRWPTSYGEVMQVASDDFVGLVRVTARMLRMLRMLDREQALATEKRRSDHDGNRKRAGHGPRC